MLLLDYFWKSCRGFYLFRNHGDSSGSRTAFQSCATKQTQAVLGRFFHQAARPPDLARFSSITVRHTFTASLSVALEDALKNAPESQRPVLTALHEKLDDLLLELLERLPQKMAEVPGGVAACQAIFEPEVAGVRHRSFSGPLRLAVQERQFSETLCVSPLVFEYMSHRSVSSCWDVCCHMLPFSLCHFALTDSDSVRSIGIPYCVVA